MVRASMIATLVAVMACGASPRGSAGQAPAQSTASANATATSTAAVLITTDKPTATPVPRPSGATPLAVATAASTPVNASDRVTIGGRTFRIVEPYLWRDFMPISEPGGKPLAASIKIQVDSGTFPSDVTVDHVWVYGPTTWEPTNIEVRRSPEAGTSADQIEVFANGGPKWDPGSEVTVDVRLVSGTATRTLRITGVTINKTS